MSHGNNSISCSAQLGTNPTTLLNHLLCTCAITFCYKCQLLIDLHESRTPLFIYLPNHLFTPLFLFISYLFIYLFIYSFLYSFIYLLNDILFLLELYTCTIQVYGEYALYKEAWPLDFASCSLPFSQGAVSQDHY